MVLVHLPQRLTLIEGVYPGIPKPPVVLEFLLGWVLGRWLVEVRR